MKRAPEPDDDETGLPGLRTWRSVYWAVVVFFVVCVALLVLLSGVTA
jgi:hypothetical protein